MQVAHGRSGEMGQLGYALAMIRRAALVMVCVSIAIAVAGCRFSGLGAGSTALPVASSPASGQTPVPLPAVPVDQSLVAVSRSAPNAAAKAALDLCVRPDDMPRVVGMALLASARDVRKYMLTNGNEPELQEDVPVWMIQLEGPVRYRTWTVVHPVCVVKGSARYIFAPYGGEGPNGVWSPSADLGFTPPQLALPSMAP